VWPHWFGPLPRAAYHGVRTSQEQREKEDRYRCHYPIWRHAPNTLRTSHWTPALKGPKPLLIGPPWEQRFNTWTFAVHYSCSDQSIYWQLLPIPCPQEEFPFRSYCYHYVHNICYIHNTTIHNNLFILCFPCMHNSVWIMTVKLFFVFYFLIYLSFLWMWKYFLSQVLQCYIFFLI
jgi:hypothetical protein